MSSGRYRWAEVVMVDEFEPFTCQPWQPSPEWDAIMKRKTPPKKINVPLFASLSLLVACGCFELGFVNAARVMYVPSAFLVAKWFIT